MTISMASDLATLDILLDAVIKQDDARPRTQQVELGPSSLGSCKRQVVMKIMGLDPINPVERLPSILGTAIHAMIESALRESGHDSVELEVPGLPGLLGPGHIDFYQPGRKTITDWKTTQKKHLRYFPKPSQIWQVQTYGYLARQAGFEVEWVELVAIPRDGTSKDVKLHREPFSETKAVEAIDWLRGRQAEAFNGVLPEAEMNAANFCRPYCPFFGAYCAGL